MIKILLDRLESFLHRSEYEKNIKNSAIHSYATRLLSSSYSTNYYPNTEHPLHTIRLQQNKNLVKTWNSGKSVAINFGDSLTDMARAQTLRFHNGVFSISGSWAHHIEGMIIDMKEALSPFDVNNVSIGCLGGNPLLVYQDYDRVLQESLRALDTCRSSFPNARIVVYGLPPVYNIHVLENTYQYDSQLELWCKRDIDARFLNLKALFGFGLGRLFPSCQYSSDGIHFNPNGANKFSEAIHKLQK